MCGPGEALLRKVDLARNEPALHGKRDAAGLLGLGKDRDGWPMMPPPKADPIHAARLALEKGIPSIRPSTPRAATETGHPTGNKPALANFPPGALVRSPYKEHLIEESQAAMTNRMVVYHGHGGPRASHPDGDYIAPDGHRSRTLPEHLAHIRLYMNPVPYKDARSGESFTDPAAYRAHQVAHRHKKSKGQSIPVRSTR